MIGLRNCKIGGTLRRMKNRGTKPRQKSTIFFYQKRCQNASARGRNGMTTKEKPKENENIYEAYKKAYPGRCKSESELLERIAFLLLMPEPKRTGIFLNISEEEVDN